MANNDVRLALIEKELLRLAEECGISKVRHDKTDEWIHEHEKTEINRHGEVMAAIQNLTNSLAVNKEKGRSRLAVFDRIWVILSSLIGLTFFLYWLYNQIKGIPVPKP